ncbi:MAG: aminoglycoside phosphotransferase family protein [Planctomycetia bacterium]|nr:aminoglycoside phosphotransferase family protein [Planctomycetia bacterium]
MTVSKQHLDILCNYHDDCVAGPVESLGSAGGFSGAAFWKVHGKNGDYCLRRWPKGYPTLEKLQFIHAVLWQANQEGFRKLPLPVETLEHLTFVSDREHYWQLEPWIRGEADYASHPGSKRLVSAMVTLAEFHQAVRNFPLPATKGASSLLLNHEKGLLSWGEERFQRLEQTIRARGMGENEDRSEVCFLSDLSDSDAPQMAKEATIPFPLPARQKKMLENISLRILRNVRQLRQALLGKVVQCGNYAVALQPCIRDIHAGHLFFVRNQVSGIIDFENLQADNVATDVARLLGSLAENDPLLWVLGLTAYQSVRRLTDPELEILHTCKKSYVATTALRWLDYIYVQKNPVRCSAHLLRRLKNLETCLEYL